MNDTFPPVSPERAGATHDEISARAQQLWEDFGRPVGRDEEIWLQAERALRDSTPPSSETVAPAASDRAPVEASNAPRGKSSASATPRKTSSRNPKAATR